MFVCQLETDYLLASGAIWVVLMTFILTGGGGGALQGEGEGGHCLCV